MVWNRLPTSWENAPFLGNGVVGMQVMREASSPRSLKIEVSRMDAQEHMSYPPAKDMKLHTWAYLRYRVPIGYFTIQFSSPIKGCQLELDLWNAELKGDFTTEDGTTSICAFVHATGDLIAFNYLPQGKQKKPVIKWHPYENKSPRSASWQKLLYQDEAPWSKEGPKGRQLNPSSDTSVWEQPLRPKGLVSTAWKIRPDGNKATSLLISIVHSFPDQSASVQALNNIKIIRSISFENLKTSHRNWWHQYYRKSFLSLSDPYWEPFYWTQIYKIGSGMRENGPILDLQGPWTGLPRNAWPGIWWNLNAQLTYWPCYTGNRLEEAMSLSNNLKKHRKSLINNVAPQYRHDSAAIPRSSAQDIDNIADKPEKNNSKTGAEIGSLPWVCHNLFLHYRMTMDDDFLKEDVYPLLRRAINYYIHFLEKDSDGKYHLFPTFSPEYRTAPDCNYDLALLRWGCETLIWSASRLNINDPLLDKWKDILTNLADYPVNQNGYMIGQGVPFSGSHRHYSHLFMIYPLHLVDMDNPDTRALAEKSILHWLNKKGGLMGYSFSGGASLYACLQQGDNAYETLNGIKRYIAPNTLYKESWPVIETPLSAIASVHDMILQSWNNRINVFAAVPSEWKNIAFHNMRAEGAFLVSAQRKEGKTQWVHLSSLAGEPIVLHSGMSEQAEIKGSGASYMKRGQKGIWTGTPPANTEILLTEPGVKADIRPVDQTEQPVRFGLSK